MKPSLLFLILSISLNFSALAAVPDVWTIRTSPNTSDLHGVAYGQGAFVAVGSQTTILRSHDGMNWNKHSVGTTAPTLFCVHEGSLLLGGETSVLMLGTLGGFSWYSVLSTIGVEHIFDIVLGNQTFVAVGLGPHIETSYVATSHNAYDWGTQTAPTTNTLWSVAHANSLFVAVGNLGTIVTSPNGTNWTLRTSGTQRALRAVVFHQPRFLAAGDAGTVLQSSDGITWSPSAPTSFEVRGLTSGNGVVIAIGSRDGGGRLHASIDGLGWPGTSHQFPQPLNAITYANGSFVAVGNQGFIIQSEGLTNECTKPTSGDWQEPFWSLDELPSTNHALIAFRNPGFKALAIQSSTTANYADSLSIRNLLVDAPPASANLLLLNYAGLNVPLNVMHDFAIGTNGALLSYYSALQASNLQVNGTATFAEGSTAAIGHYLQVGEDLNGPFAGGIFGQLVISNAALSTTYFDVPNGRVTHTAGTNIVDRYFALSSLHGGEFSEYLLSGGLLKAQYADIGYLGPARFRQTGGVHTNRGMLIYVRFRNPTNTERGEYTLSDGMLHCGPACVLYGGALFQSGGTNNAGFLHMYSGGLYSLSGGTLNSTRVSVGPHGGIIPAEARTVFLQNGGTHTVLGDGNLFVKRSNHYFLEGGTFTVWSIVLEYGGSLNLTGGTIINGGGVTMNGAILRVDGVRDFGHLQLRAPSPYSTDESLIDLGDGFTGQPDRPSVVRFLDSSWLRWDTNALLTITNWTGSINGGGIDRVIFGTNSSALTPAQLARIQFVDPEGLDAPPGRYPARILASGEVVPGDSASLAFMRSTNGIVLTWSDNFELLTATNIAGPFMSITGVTSPYTNSFTDPQRFFYLRSRSP